MNSFVTVARFSNPIEANIAKGRRSPWQKYHCFGCSYEWDDGWSQRSH